MRTASVSSSTSTRVGLKMRPALTSRIGRTWPTFRGATQCGSIGPTAVTTDWKRAAAKIARWPQPRSQRLMDEKVMDRHRAGEIGREGGRTGKDSKRGILSKIGAM